MRLTCPACAASYEVPDARIGTGRRLRCSRCRHDWFVNPLDSGPATTPSPAKDPAAAGAVTPAAAASAAPPSAGPGEAVAARAAPVPTVAPGAAPAPLPADAAPPAAGAADASPAGAPAPGLGTDASRLPRSGPAASAEGGATARPAAPARSRPLLIAWAATLFLLCGFAAAVMLNRSAIIEAWPPAARFYAAIGLPLR